MIDSNSFILDTIFETLPSGLCLFDATGRIIRINYKAKEILGLEADAPLESLDALPAYLKPLRDTLMASSEDASRLELALQLPAREEESTIGFSLKTIETPEGSQIRTLTFTDITQVLKDRLALDKIKDELNQSRKLASIGTMIAGVAHELNNPLTGISMSASLSKMNLERLKKNATIAQETKIQDSLDKALMEVAKIGRACDKAGVLVSDLLAYSKPSQLHLAPFVLNDILNDVTLALKSHPQFSQFTLHKADDAHNRQVLADRVKLEQVFYNLIKNACDATEGKGTVDIRFTEQTDEHGKRYIVTHVKDNGPGIDKTVIARIFDPFFTTKGHSGVGLGLSISYRTVEQHGGLLSVESTKWEGTEFQVTLPVYEDEG